MGEVLIIIITVINVYNYLVIKTLFNWLSYNQNQNNARNNHNRRKQSNKQSNFEANILVTDAKRAKHARASHDWFRLYFSLAEKGSTSFSNRSQSVVKQNQSKRKIDLYDSAAMLSLRRIKGFVFARQASARREFSARLAVQKQSFYSIWQ